MFLAVFLIAKARDDELILAWFTTFNVVLGVKERPVCDEQRHFKSPVVNLKVILLVHWFDGYFLIVGGE